MSLYEKCGITCVVARRSAATPLVAVQGFATSRVAVIVDSATGIASETRTQATVILGLFLSKSLRQALGERLNLSYVIQRRNTSHIAQNLNGNASASTGKHINNGQEGSEASSARMSSFHCLLSILLAITQRSLASFPTDNFVEEEPAMAVGPDQIAQAPIAHPHVAPVVAPIPHVAPAPYYHPYLYPYSMYSPYYHPRTEVRNVVKSYAKETGHASETAMISGGGHLPAVFDVHPPEHMSDLSLPAPWRSRVHRQKHLKKASRAHKSVNKKRN